MLVVQPRGVALAVVVLFESCEQARRTADECLALPPVGAYLIQLGRLQTSFAAAVALVQSVPRRAAVKPTELRAEDRGSGLARAVDVHYVAQRPLALEAAQHRARGVVG